jgi:hypothetical protein
LYLRSTNDKLQPNQPREAYMGFLDSLIQTPVFHAQQVGKTYSQNPDQALLSVNTPLDAYVTNSLLGTRYQPTVSMFGGPTAAQYAEGQRQGVDLSAGRTADAIVPAVAGAVGSVFGGPAGGMAAYQGTSALKGLGDVYDANLARSNAGYQGYKSYAEGGLASASKHLEEGKVTKIISHYFQNRGIPLQIGLAELKKEVANGLKFVQFEDSVMAYKILKPGVAQIHFFTIATIAQLADDMRYFIAELKNMGIHTVYDTEPAPVTTESFKRYGGKLEQSDNPNYKFKATI